MSRWLSLCCSVAMLELGRGHHGHLARIGTPRPMLMLPDSCRVRWDKHSNRVATSAEGSKHAGTSCLGVSLGRYMCGPKIPPRRCTLLPSRHLFSDRVRSQTRS